MESLRKHMINEGHTQQMATINNGNQIVHTFTFAELDMTICQSQARNNC
jgi:hypothetical protein